MCTGPRFALAYMAKRWPSYPSALTCVYPPLVAFLAVAARSGTACEIIVPDVAATEGTMQACSNSSSSSRRCSSSGYGRDGSCSRGSLGCALPHGHGQLAEDLLAGSLMSARIVRKTAGTVLAHSANGGERVGVAEHYEERLDEAAASLSHAGVEQVTEQLAEQLAEQPDPPQNGSVLDGGAFGPGSKATMKTDSHVAIGNSDLKPAASWLPEGLRTMVEVYVHGKVCEGVPDGGWDSYIHVKNSRDCERKCAQDEDCNYKVFARVGHNDYRCYDYEECKEVKVSKDPGAVVFVKVVMSPGSVLGWALVFSLTILCPCLYAESLVRTDLN